MTESSLPKGRKSIPNRYKDKRVLYDRKGTKFKTSYRYNFFFLFFKTVGILTEKALVTPHFLFRGKFS